MRGPIPQSREQADANGNPGKRPNRGRGALTAARPKPPNDLKGEARAEWDRLVPELEEAGLLARVDRAALSEMCRAWGDIQQLRAMIAEDGPILKAPIQTAKGEKIGTKFTRHPASLSLAEAFKRWAYLAAQYGLTAASRMRMHIGAEAEVGEEDELLKILNAAS